MGGRGSSSGMTVGNNRWVDGDDGFRVFEHRKYNDYRDEYQDLDENGFDRGYGEFLADEKRNDIGFLNEQVNDSNWFTDEISDAERDAIEKYQNSSVAINGQLRSGGVKPATAKKINTIEGAIDKSVNSVPFVAHRDVSGKALGFDRQPTVAELRNMVGKTITEKGFASCNTKGSDSSFTSDRAARGMGAPKNNRVIMHIGIPKGKGIVGIAGYGTVYASEAVLNRGAKLKILGAYEKNGVVHANLAWVGRQVDPIKSSRR